MLSPEQRYVYIIQCTNSGAIKIGQTTQNNPFNRIYQIQLNNPFPLEVLTILLGDKWLEAHLRERFSSFRLKGEWVSGDCQNELIAYVKSYKTYEATSVYFEGQAEVTMQDGVVNYARGSSIPKEKRDHRFSHKGKASEIALRKYWRLLKDGSPDPKSSSFRTKKDIDLFHLAHPELGEYKINVNSVGRPRQITDRVEYQRQYWLNRKAEKKISGK